MQYPSWGLLPSEVLSEKIGWQRHMKPPFTKDSDSLQQGEDNENIGE